MRSSIIAVLCALAGCHCGSSKPDVAATAPPAPVATKGERAIAGPPLAEKYYYRLDLANLEATSNTTPLSCKVSAPCEIRIALTALAGHHINSEYPTKFVAVPTGDLVVDKASFTIESQTRGVMSIRVTPASAGTHTLDGQFKLGVCTDDKCEIDGPKIAVSIAAS